MANGFVINDTTYAGEAASRFIVKAITGNETVQGGHVYIKDGIKKKYTIPRFDANYEDFIQDRAAVPTSKGSFTVDGKMLDPQDYMIYTEFNPRDYEDHWFATQLQATIANRPLPGSVESVVIEEVLKRHDKYMNKALWNNSTANAAPSIYRYYDGFIKKSVDDADCIDVSSPVTLTATNIQAELQRGYDLIPDALKYDTNMKIFMNYKHYDQYMQSQIAQIYKGDDITQRGRDTFRGLRIVKIADLPDNFYFIAKGMATPESNLWIGLNSVDDAKLELKQLQANAELWFIKMNMKVDVQIGWGSETIMYKA
ncbi:MAG: hypothetical protein EOP56_09410 [Sphingobacteriales bacterium]|nr:MAG: hypothetical protein EOP56_09410 [Sphingobacteriales bacterium]